MSNPGENPIDRSIDEALKRLGLGPYYRQSLEETALAVADAMHRRIADAVKQHYRDRAPTKDEFANFVGHLYRDELYNWLKSNSDEALFYLTLVHVNMAYKALID